jgi:spore coat-associated protein N
MKKKVVLSLMLILVAASVIGGSAFAAFLDLETSTNNTFTAGTLDLKTNDADGVTQTLYATSMKPGQSLGPATIVLKNAGSINGATLDIVFNYTENDGTNPPEFPMNKTADETAAVLEINTLEYGGFSLLSAVTDYQPNGYKDIEDLKHANLSGLSGINASQTKDFIIKVTLRSGIGNEFQADGINMTITFMLNQ